MNHKNKVMQRMISNRKKSKTKIEQLKLRANNLEEKYKSIDNGDEHQCIFLTKLWKNDCESEEIISFQRWNYNI